MENKLEKKERLSKLQKWILEKCLKEGTIWRGTIREFFGKKFSEKPKWYRDVVFDYHKEGKKLFDKEGLDINDYEFFIARNGVGDEFDAYRPKKEKCSTRSIEATISRSLKKLIVKELLTQPKKYGKYRLTEKGFLKVNKTDTVAELLTFKKYQEKLDRQEQEQEEAFKKLVGNLHSIMGKDK